MQNYCMNCMMPIEEGRACPHCGWSGSSTAAPYQLRPGTVLNGRYFVGRVIGQGGFGITYVGRDTRLDLKIAVKEYYPAGCANRNTEVSDNVTVTDKRQQSFIEDGKQKFLREARTLAKFNEESGVVNVRDSFEANQTAYIIMDFLDGRDLRQCLKDALFTPDRIFALMAPIFDALERIHKEDMIHRDISPDNIMMLKNGTLKLMDFGAARQVNFSDQRSVSIVLKAGFAPEEQYRSKGKQGPWTDVYALCATIYKCITGVTPDDSLQRSARDELKWPSELGISITRQQEDVLKKGMAIRQQNRFQSIGELKAALSGTGTPVQSIEVDIDADGEYDRTEYFPHPGRDREDDPTEYYPHSGKDAGGENSSEENRDHDSGGTDREPAPRKTRPVLIAGAAALLVIVLAAAVWSGGKEPAPSPTSPGAGASASAPPGAGSSGAGPSGAGPSGAPEAEPAGRQPDAGMYHIVLTMDEDMTVKEFNDTLPVLTGRLDAFTGGSSYEMNVEEETIDLYLPKAVFGEAQVDQILKCYITRRIELYLFDKSAASGRVRISREDLESVTLCNGAIDGVDAAEYGVDTPTYEYLTVALTDACAARLQEKIAAWGDDLTFGQDIDDSPASYFYHNTFPAGDGKTFYILIHDPGSVPGQLAVYNFTHDSIPHAFGVKVDLDSVTAWEDPAQAERRGAKQREISEVTGQTVTVSFQSPYSAKDMTVGELLDMETELKARMDILDQPYAFGWIEKDTSAIMVVKTGLERMGTPIMNLLSQTSVYLSADLMYSVLPVDQLSWEKTGDGTYRVNIDADSNRDKLELYTGYLAGKGGGPLFLTAWSIASRSMPLLSTEIDRKSGDGRITFDRLCFGGGTEITDENLFAVQLMQRAWTHSQSDSLVVKDKQINLEGGLAEFDERLFGMSYGQAQQDFEDAALSVVPGARVRVRSGSPEDIDVNLRMDINERLPEAAAAAAREIYEISGFEESVYAQLTIYLVDENDTDGERARIYFCKYPNSPGNEPENGYVYVTGVFTNGRLEPYKEAFRQIVETDPFYLGLTAEELTAWNFGTEADS